jgi:hypothetical protein
VTQPSGAGTLVPNECKDYDVMLDGNSQWLLPVPVIDGYVVTITATAGGWNDGSGFDGWFCPDGSNYVLGGCGSVKGHVGGDPSSILYHAQLMINVAGTYYDPFAGPVTLSGVSGAQNLLLQMNDASLSDNAGSIQFHVNVCATDTALWCYKMDFTTSDYGFDAYNPPYGTYSTGVGWLGVDSGGATALQIYKAFSSAYITSFDLEIDGMQGASHNYVALYTGTPGSEVPVGGIQTLLDGLHTYTFSVPGTYTSIIPDPSIQVGGAITLKSMTFRGTGTNPFGADNC